MASSSTAMDMANPPKPLRTCTILKEALILPKKNSRLISSVFLISLLASSLYFSAYQLTIYPLLTDSTIKSTSIKELIAIELIFTVVAFIITFVLRTITIYALAMTYMGKLLTLKELLCQVKGMMKGPMITQFYISLLSLGYILLLIAFVMGFFYISNASVFLISLVVLFSLIAIAVYLYLITLWSLSITVSVIEQGCYGVGAMKRATELIKGRKCKGVLTIVIAIVLVAASSVVYGLVFVSVPGSLWSQLAVGLVYNLEIEVLNLFVMAAITVYYYECRRRRGEEENSDAIANLGYASLPATDGDDV